MAAGFDGYVAKPIEPQTFVQQVQSHLCQAKRDSGMIMATGTRCRRLADQSRVSGDLLGYAGTSMQEAATERKPSRRSRQSPPELVITDV